MTLATAIPQHAQRYSPFAPLRARLIASHVLVILLALALVLAISAVLLRRDERHAQIDDLHALAVPLLVEIRALNRGGVVREQALETLLGDQAAEIDARILILAADGTVLHDTAVDGLQGELLTPYSREIAAVSSTAARQNATVRRIADPSKAGPDPFDGEIVLLAATGRRIAGNDLNPDVLALVAEPRSQGVTRRLFPPLLFVVAIALTIASVAGYLLSRRIAAPVARLTAAADAMAAGHLEQQVVAEGGDEIARLITSFNTMSHQVATTSRAQRELLGNIAHELRTPLTSVQGFTQALRDGLIASPEDTQRTLATIAAESDRMARLIGQLLDLARIESGQVRLNLGPVPLAGLLSRIQSRFQPEAGARGIVILSAATTNPVALGDAGRLDQILTNLVSNALQHTPTGGEVVLAAVTELDRTVRLTVRDTGSGIPPDQLPHIFDRFHRASSDTPGFGLGLAIVRELVTLHHGSISVSSHPRTGTTFTITLPSG